ncbi:FIG00351101: hypothetical protein [Pseudoalteromonas luteoviolacea B = ATCC 29581]|nr:FIG00351101: hypothetical protein [Pseudoalteromonas luteoviolacea B = ATCC 29581]
MQNQIKPGLYQHYKGNLYRVLFVATHSETQESLVVYQTQYDKFDHWVRPLSMFIETVTIEGKAIPRFRFLGEHSQD